LDDFHHFWIIGIFAIGKNNGGHGIQRANRTDVFIYLLRVIRAKNQEVALMGGGEQITK